MSENKANKLENAIRSYRALPDAHESLSPGVRARIVDQASAPSTGLNHLSPIFFPWARTAAVSAVPAALLLFALVGLWPASVEPTASVPGTVEVAKIGNEVVFTIANGGQPHTIQKSHRPDRFDGSATVVKGEDRFVDSLESGSKVVFYRID